jgi:hypothetical protein
LGRLSNQPELPRPELNPLLNPRLAENMGRWAEVYFTAPPEKRDEAVLDLLRELDSETVPDNGVAAFPPSAEMLARDLQPPKPVVAGPVAVPDPVPSVRCAACGHDNPESHQFCGMCGSNLKSWDRAGEPARSAPENPVPAERAFERGREDSAGREAAQWHADPGPSFPEPGTESDELTLFRSISSGGYNEKIDWTSASDASPSYRGYVGIALAVILLSLGYLFWRSTQASQSVHQVPAAPPQAVPETARPATPSDAPSPAASSAASAPQPAEDSRAQAAATPPASPKPAPAARPTPAAASPAPPSPAAAGTSGAGYGGEELAMAERYLNGGNGQARESAEAAKWLWKSVAKHNSTASLLLADLYLKGDGVSKNCDQARVLLDAAAIKGVAGAGERLRHLQAFGCQ